MAELDKIWVQNFKSIRKLELDFKPLNVFIGANGAGKSNLINVFMFLNQMVDGNLQNYTAAFGGADSLLYLGRKISESISIKLSFQGGVNGYSCVLSPAREDNFYFEDESVWFHDKNHYRQPYEDYLGSGHLESELSKHSKERMGPVRRYVRNHFGSWKLYHFHDTSDSARIKQTGDLEDNSILRPDARNLAAFLYWLKERYSDHFENIEDVIRSVAPFFDKFTLQPSRLNPDKIRLEWKEKGTDTYFSAAALSDGSLRFMCLATLLLQPHTPSVILLDEPELGLHPYAISVLAGLMQSAAERSQILVATQSVTLVNQLNIEDLVVVEREEGQSVFQRLDKTDMSDWLEEYGLGDLWEKNILGGRP